ncbi:hypothetical protein JCM24511_04785 [Saitozyma sp. JCM 24511]|nr:hypothetical protein JCM24511_04785 [Saitozyma sp. JCM 24511]
MSLSVALSPSQAASASAGQQYKAAATFKYLQGTSGRAQRKAKCQRPYPVLPPSWPRGSSRLTASSVKRDIASLCVADDLDHTSASNDGSTQVDPTYSDHSPARKHHKGSHSPLDSENGGPGSFPESQTTASIPTSLDVPPHHSSVPPDPHTHRNSTSPTASLSFLQQPALPSSFDANFNLRTPTGDGVLSSLVSSTASRPVATGPITTSDIEWSAFVESILDPLASGADATMTMGDMPWIGGGRQDGTVDGREQSHVAVETHTGTGLTPFLSLSPPTAQRSPSKSSEQVTRASATAKTTEEEVPQGFGSDPADYTFAYSRLKSFAADLSEIPLRARISAATDSFKPLLHTRLSQYTDDQLVAAESQLSAYVRRWVEFCESIPAPACVFRRTGELCAGNSRMVAALDVTPGSLAAGKVALYHILDPASFTEYWEQYAACVLRHITTCTPFDVSLAVSFVHGRVANSGVATEIQGRRQTHVMCSTMTFDSFSLPLVSTAIFAPLPPPRSNGTAIVAPMVLPPAPWAV